MSATSRLLNRALLLVGGLVLVASGAATILTGAAAGWTRSWLPADPVTAALSPVRTWAATLPRTGGVPGAVTVTAAVATVLVILLVVFVLTRGGGRTRTVLRLQTEEGATSVDHDLPEAMLARALGERPDVFSARTSVYRVKGEPAIRLTMTVRRGADLARVLSAAELAVREWDAFAGREIPVIVHLADQRWRDRLRASARVR